MSNTEMADRHQQTLERLRSVIVGVAGCPPDAVTEQVSFLDLGFDSLSMMQLAAALQDAFGVPITFRQLFDVMPTVGAAARHLDGALPAGPAESAKVTGDRLGTMDQLGETKSSARPVPTVLNSLILQQLDVMSKQLDEIGRATHPSDELVLPIAGAATNDKPGKDSDTPTRDYPPSPFPTTDAQQELWFLSRISDEASAALNESNRLSIDGSLDADVLAMAIEAVLAQHEALNVRFAADGESQQLDPTSRIMVTRDDLSLLEAAQQETALDKIIETQAILPFDFQEGPLGRVRLVKLNTHHHLLLTYFPHITYDGYSGGILMAEISAEYNARRLGLAAPATPTKPFSEYVERQRARCDEASVARALAYWAGQFPTPPPALALPTCKPRGPVTTWRGQTVHHVLTLEQLTTVRTLAKTNQTTVSTVLLSAFELLLARLARQDEIVVGIPAAGQINLGVNAVGYCVNTLPIHSRPIARKPFADLVRETQDTVLDAIDHQDMALGSIVRAQRIVAMPGRLPLVEVMFSYSTYLSGMTLDECQIVAHENRREAVVYDLFLHVVESADRLILDWDFRTELFDQSTVEHWVTDYVNLIETLSVMSGEPKLMASHG